MAAMRVLALAALAAAALLASAPAFADEPSPSTPTAATPAAPAGPLPAAAVPVHAAPAPSSRPVYSVPDAIYPAAYAMPPPAWAPAPLVTERRSNGMRITGIALFTVGGVISAFGGVVFGAVSATGCPNFAIRLEENDGPPPPSPEAVHERVGTARLPLNGCDTSPELGLGLIGAGALVAAAGIPLFVIGSKQVPARSEFGNLLPVVRLGAGSGSLRWTF
jgi:hypothetical protein